jgi:GNAT superfamily N-acetyltransferase
VVAPLEAAAAANFVVHASWAASQSPEARVETGPELTVVDSGLEADTFNVVCAARLLPEDVDETARRVVRHFAEAGRPFSWWISPGDEPADLARRLEACGLEQAESELAMAAPIQALAAPPRVPGLRIARVDSPEGLASFARITAENWSPPDTVVEAYYRRAAPGLLSAASPQRFYLAQLDGAPVAAVELTVGAGVAGVYNLSTRASHRRRGVGAELLYAALSEAGRQGAASAVLQASASGASLYRRLGFAEFGVITEHKPARS